MNAVLKSLPKALAAEVRQIEVKPGRLGQMVDAGEVALASTGLVFNRGGVLVRLDPASGGTVPLASSVCRVDLARAARWVRQVRSEDGGWKLVQEDPPRPVSAALVEMGHWQHIPKLRAVVDHPLWLAPGRAHEGGYDLKSGIYCTAPQPAWRARADATQEEAEESLCALRDAIKTFPWAAPCDEAAALASMLCSLSRPVLEVAPLLLITAPTPGSGKGLLGQAIAQFAQASPAAGATLSADDEEVRKDLFSRLLQSRQVIFFDEIAGVAGASLDSPALRTLATSPIFSSRILGSTRESEVSTSTLVIISANNATPGADSARRMIEIRLDPRCESPAGRRFTGPEPAAFINSHRQEMIRAAMTIQAAYIHAGLPGLADLPPVSNYSDWNFWARGPIAWLLGIDPAQRLVEAQRVDSRAGEIAETLAAIHSRMSSTRWKAAELLQHQDTTTAMREALGLPPNREPGSRQVGRWLMGARDRMAGGFVLREASRAGGSVTWQISRT